MTPGVRAKVIVIAGPSGSGKSRLAERTGLPVLRLDDFYKDGSDPSLPRIAEGGANAGLVDWDHPDSWLEDDAFTALEALCLGGVGDVPVYDIAQDGRTGWQHLDLAGATHFVADGIFAQEIVPRAREAGLLVRRGFALMRAQRDVVAHAVALGCRPVSNSRALEDVARLVAGTAS